MTEHSWFGPASQGVPELRAQDPQPLRDLPGLFVFQCP